MLYYFPFKNLNSTISKKGKTVVDTGAGASIVSLAFAEALGLKLRDCRVNLTVPGKSKVDIEHCVTLSVNIGGINVVIQRALVLPGLHYDVILGVNELWNNNYELTITKGNRPGMAKLYIEGGKAVYGWYRKTNNKDHLLARAAMGNETQVNIIGSGEVYQIDGEVGVEDHDTIIMWLADGLAIINGENLAAPLEEVGINVVQHIDESDMVESTVDLRSEYPQTWLDEDAARLTDKNAWKLIDINPELPERIRRSIEEKLESKWKCFAGLENSTIPPVNKTGIHSIQLIPGADLHSIKHGARRLSPQKYKVIKELVERLRETGRIKQWNGIATTAPVVVPKYNKDGTIKGYRVALDARQLNQLTVRNDNAVPRIDEMVEWFSKYKYRSTLDGCAFFYQYRLDSESSKLLTTNFGSLGVYRWLVSAFGEKNVPATVAAHMKEVLSKLPHCESYVDDILLGHGPVDDENWTVDRIPEEVDELLDVLVKHRIFISAKKTKIGYETLSVLGHSISEGIRKPCSDKIHAFRDFPMPTTRKELESFVAMVQFYHEYYPNLFKDLDKLRQKVLSSKGVLHMSEEDKDCVERIKRQLTKAMPLHYVLEGVPVRVQSDYSKGAVAVHIYQEHPDTKKIRVLAAANVRLKGPMLNYSSAEGEMAAVRWAVDKFSYFLEGRKIIWEIDNKPILKLLTQSTTKNIRLTRSALELQQYDIHLKYLPGKENVVADTLTRTSELNKSTEAAWNAYTAQPTFRNAFKSISTASKVKFRCERQ